MNAPYVLAFNDRILSLHIEQPGQSVAIAKTAYGPVGDAPQLVHVEERRPGSDPVSRWVATLRSGDMTIAVGVKRTATASSIVDQRPTPHIFVAFPLTATCDFPLPVVINDDNFKPREDRDSLVLQANRDGKHPNMLLIESACELSTRLSILAAERCWDGAATLARLNPLREWDWVDLERFRGLLAERFVEPLRISKIVTTAAGSSISPDSAAFPLSGDPDLCRGLWDLASQ